ncbi:MAG TPA: SCO family protein [Chloroflexaceae bacterium]|nr:SCO family protein [Chloroflexaceae bacterium]
MNMSVRQERQASARPESGISPRTRLILFSALGLGLLLMVAALWFAVARPVKVLPRIRPMPAFALADQYGLPLNSSDLAGRQVLINVTYTGCGDECAAQRQGLVALRESLRAEGRLGREVIFLTISFDPARDTPASLQTYAAQLGADRDSWRFVSGEPTELKALIGGELGIYYAPPDAAGRIEHEQDVLLIDGNGVLRARYNGAALDQARLQRDLAMVREELGSTGAMRQVYEASHIFLCYPPD